MHRASALTLVLLIPGAVRAQAPEPTDTTALATRDVLVPLHTGPTDPIGGAYGIWCAGPDWKASFHDGFRFFAFAPDLPEHPTLAWRTTSVSVGDEPIPLDSPTQRYTALRLEIGHGVIREVYEIRRDGVEQSFVIDKRPAGTGPLVVSGRATTNLSTAHTTPRVGALEFAYDGITRIRYGEALAFDATGRSQPVATSYDGEHIRLHVDAGFVATATYPLTIDPLTSAQPIAGISAQIVEQAFVGSQATGSTAALIALVLQTSANDTDLIAFTCTETGAVGFSVFNDLTTSWSTRRADAAEVTAANRWVCAFEREFPSTATTAARLQVVDLALHPGGPGTTLFAPNDTRAPRIGGRRDGSVALAVYGTSTGIALQTVDVVTPALLNTRPISATINDWSVSRAASGTSAWCVLAATASQTTAYFATSSATTPSVVALGTIGAPAGAGQPEVDGDNARFLATWVETSATLSTRRLRAQRLSLSGATVTTGTVQSVASVSLLTTLANGQVAYDHTTQSHWAVCWTSGSLASSSRTARVARLGHHGGVVESQELHTTTQAVDPLDPFVCFDGSIPSGTRPTFSCGYGVYLTGLAGYFVQHRTFEYDPGAQASLYGTSCSNAVLGDGHPPYAGSEFYNINAAGLPANSVAYVSVGVAPTNIPLDAIGMPGCRILTDPLVTLSTATDANGLALLYIPLNDVPVFLGDLYCQWVWLEPGANQLGVLNSRGLLVQIR